MTPSRYIVNYVFCLPLVWLSSCVGTDVVEDPITSLKIDAEGAFVHVGDAITMRSLGVNQFGDEFEVNAVWTGSNDEIAAVDAAGLVLGLAPGQVSIMASFRGTEAAPYLLTVVDSTSLVAYIQVSGAKNTLTTGEKLNLTATIFNPFDEPIDQDREVFWLSGNPAVAAVADNGEVEAFAVGQTSITASIDSISSQPYLIEVIDGSVRTGSFEGAAGHKASGTAMLSADGAGGVQLMLSDDFEADNGPGLYLYLSDSPSNVNGGVEIAPLTQLNGPSAYTVPNTSLQDFDYVIIYCKPFKIVVGRALLN